MNKKLLYVVTRGIATRSKCLAISSKYTTRNKKLPVTKGIATRSKCLAISS